MRRGEKGVALVHQKNYDLRMESVNYLNITTSCCQANAFFHNDAMFYSHSHFIQLHWQREMEQILQTHNQF